MIDVTALVTYFAVMSITPGPNNVMVTSPAQPMDIGPRCRMCSGSGLARRCRWSSSRLESAWCFSGFRCCIPGSLSSRPFTSSIWRGSCSGPARSPKATLDGRSRYGKPCSFRPSTPKRGSWPSRPPRCFFPRTHPYRDSSWWSAGCFSPSISLASAFGHCSQRGAASAVAADLSEGIQSDHEHLIGPDGDPRFAGLMCLTSCENPRFRSRTNS